MELNKAVAIMEDIKNGTLGTIEYKSELPVNKDAKKEGIKVVSWTKKMVRFGAAYKNLVKEDSSTEKKPRTNNYTWVVQNKVSHNSNTEKDYIRVSNINRKTIRRMYALFVDGEVKTLTDNVNELANYLQPSYFNSTEHTKPVVQNISIGNVVSINGLV